MNILINGSNQKMGGGIQVADSIIRQITRFPQHNFVVVGTKEISSAMTFAEKHSNIKCYVYNMPNSIKGVIMNRNAFLDNLVKINKIDAVLTIFGPSKWRPKALHICGFAKPQLVIPESPFWGILSLKQRIKYQIKNYITKKSFKSTSDIFFTENEYISEKLRELFPNKKVYTITNNYNQIFDYNSQWDKSIKLPFFEGTTLVTIAANYPHKNLFIIPQIAHYLKKEHPDFAFRFVVSIDKKEMPCIDDTIESNIIFLGKTRINQCPYIYEQSDIMFLPTLLECFSASYAEAMRMGIPIMTSDLGFAHSLCGNAAIYFNPLDVKDISEKIYCISSNNNLKKELIKNGKERLFFFDDYKSRTDKLIKILENEFSN